MLFSDSDNNTPNINSISFPILLCTYRKVLIDEIKKQYRLYLYVKYFMNRIQQRK